jgi:hypothetical protein
VAFPVLLQASGLGPIRPNIALFNWFDRESMAEDAPAMRSFGTYLRTALRNGCNVVVLAARKEVLARLVAEEDRPRRIDVWWRGAAGSKLALLLAYLMSRREPWTQARLRVLAECSPDSSLSESEEALRAELDEARIPAEVVIVENAGWETIRERSVGTSLAFVTFRVTADSLRDASGEALPTSLDDLPPMALVLAAREIDLEAQPDEGAQAEVARAQDAREDVDARATTLRARADELREAAGRATEALETARKTGAPAEEVAEARRAVEVSETESAAADRKAVKAEARRDELAREANAVTTERTTSTVPEAPAPPNPPEVDPEAD